MAGQARRADPPRRTSATTSSATGRDWSRSADLRRYDEVVVCNDTYVGPLRPYRRLFDEMAGRAVDFWGLSASQRISPHVQSFFVAFRPWLVSSRAFGSFWERHAADLGADEGDPPLRGRPDVATSPMPASRGAPTTSRPRRNAGWRVAAWRGGWPTGGRSARHRAPRVVRRAAPGRMEPRRRAGRRRAGRRAAALRQDRHVALRPVRPGARPSCSAVRAAFPDAFDGGARPPRGDQRVLPAPQPREPCGPRPPRSDRCAASRVRPCRLTCRRSPPRRSRRDDVALVLRSGLFDQAWVEQQLGTSFALLRTPCARTWGTASCSPHPSSCAEWIEPKFGRPDAGQDPLLWYLRDSRVRRWASTHPLLDVPTIREPGPRARGSAPGTRGGVAGRAGPDTPLPARARAPDTDPGSRARREPRRPRRRDRRAAAGRGPDRSRSSRTGSGTAPRLSIVTVLQRRRHAPARDSGVGAGPADGGLGAARRRRRLEPTTASRSQPGLAAFDPRVRVVPFDGAWGGRGTGRPRWRPPGRRTSRCSLRVRAGRRRVEHAGAWTGSGGIRDRRAGLTSVVLPARSSRCVPRCAGSTGVDLARHRAGRDRSLDSRCGSASPLTVVGGGGRATRGWSRAGDERPWHAH